MGRKKKYKIASVNFGDEGHPARLLIESYIKKNGKLAVSSLIRKLIVVSLSRKHEYRDYKLQLLLYERKNALQRKVDAATEIFKIEEQLKKITGKKDIDEILF